MAQWNGLNIQTDRQTDKHETDALHLSPEMVGVTVTIINKKSPSNSGRGCVAGMFYGNMYGFREKYKTVMQRIYRVAKNGVTMLDCQHCQIACTNLHYFWYT